MISIIIPVFNAERYVSMSFYSLLKQNYKNFEVIYINDGSTDLTESILNELIVKDNRFYLYTIENKGAALARLKGVGKSNFDYITFLDVDDSLDDDFINILFNKVLMENVDIICSGFTLVKNDLKLKKRNIKSGCYFSNDYLVELLRNSGWELCAKIYKKSLFYNLELPKRKLLIAEDAFIFIQLVLHSEKILVHDSFLYNYNIHVESISHKKSLKTIEDGLFVADYLSKILMGKASQVDIDIMVLLFYSNSLRRGFLPNDNLYFQVVKRSINVKSLIGLPKVKAIFVFIMYIINQFKR